MYELGRLEAPDPRDSNHLMSASLLGIAWPKYQRKRWTPGPVMNQGHPQACWGFVNSCVGHGWKQFMMTTPSPSPLAMSPTACDIYRWAINNDEFPYNDNRDMGTSVRAGVRFLEMQGRIKQYLWAWDVDTIVHWLLTRGPVVLGLPWHRDMSYPDANGFIKANGPLQGGHCIMANRVDRQEEFVEFPNSWDVTWGIKGFGKLRFDELYTLLREQGEACTAIERKLV